MPGEDEESGFASPGDAPEKLLSSGFHELLGTAPGDETAALALAFSLAAQAAEKKGKSLCFCASGGDAQEHGALYGHGLRDLGVAPEKVLMIGAPREKDLLWVLEEAVSSGAFGAVIGAFGTRERFYGFGPSRRLKLRVADRGVPLLLIRAIGQAGEQPPRMALWAVSRYAETGTPAAMLESLPLFAAAASSPLARETEVALPKMPLGEHVLADYIAIRMSLKAHPLALLREDFARAAF